MSKESFSEAMRLLKREENHLGYYIIVSLFSFGANFLITADYVHFREIMKLAGITSSIKASVLLAIALVALSSGAIIGGIISDKMKTSFPTRELIILIGTIFAALFILGMPLATTTSSLSSATKFKLILFLLTASHFFLGVAYAPWLAFMPLLFTKSEKVIAAISINIFSAFGAAIATISFSRLIDRKMPWVIWLIIAGVLLISGIITAAFQPSNKKKKPEQLIEQKHESQRLVKEKPMTRSSWVALLLVGSFWAFSSHLVETGLIDSLTNRYNVLSTTAAMSSNILMGVYIVLLLVPVFLLAAKVEKFLGGIITSGIYGLFCLLLAAMPAFQWIYFIVFVGGLGNILLSIFQFTLPAESVRKGKEGTWLGLFFAFATITKPFATMVQGVLLEGREHNQSISLFGGYPWVFLLAAIVMLASIIPLSILKQKNSRDHKKKEC